MENEIMQLASTQGIWTVLSVSLLFYILRNQEKRDQKQDERESRYQELLEKLTEQLDIVNDMKEDIEEIKSRVVPIGIKHEAKN